MKKIELAKASAPLSEYAVEAEKDPIIVLRRGKPMAAVIPLRNTDEETVALSTNKNFLKIIEKSQAKLKKHGGISPKELRRRLGLKI
jgi:PHD/YefM family antitoxin component YafN of YafNO toxin-antitoxin module